MERLPVACSAGAALGECVRADRGVRRGKRDADATPVTHDPRHARGADRLATGGATRLDVSRSSRPVRARRPGRELP